MEIFVFDTSLRLLGVTEDFEYFRWTRRYSNCGDFELQAMASSVNLDLLQTGRILWKNDDEESGIIEHIELSMEEQELVFVKGRFATSYLSRRIIWGTELLRGDVSEAVSLLVLNHLIDPLNTERKIANFNISAPTMNIRVDTQTSYRNLLAAVEDLCSAADIGMKTTFNPETRMFTLTLYQGKSSPAVFSKEFDNLNAQYYTDSLLIYAGVALVAGEGEGSERQMVTVGGGEGLGRYEMFVDAKDLREEDFGTGYLEALFFRGESKLSEYKQVCSFEAEINHHSNITYKQDFDLGDVVSVISRRWGLSLRTRIVEVEETYDRTGQSISATFGRGMLKLVQRLKGDF